MIMALLYGKLARYYDLTYRVKVKDYGKEAALVASTAGKYGKSPGKKLLDVACGTGNHLVFLRKKFDVTGLDLSREMLAIARRKLPQVRFVQGDMRKFRLGERFDVMTCMFSSINYMVRWKDLEKTLRNFHRHLEKGGVAIIECFTRDIWKDGMRPRIDVVRGKGLDYVRVGTSTRKGSRARLYFTQLIREKGRVFAGTESHDIGLFFEKDILRLAKRLGFSFAKAARSPEKRSLFILRK